MGRAKPRPRPHRTLSARALKARPFLEALEDRNLPSNGQWLAVFGGLAPGGTLDEQTGYGKNLLNASGVSDDNVRVLAAVDLSGTFVVQTPADVTQDTLTGELQAVPGFVFVQDDQPAWYVFDLFDSQPIRSWRYRRDPEATRRPLAAPQVC